MSRDLVILKSHFLNGAAGPDEEIVSFDEFKAWFRTGAYFNRLRGFRNVSLRTAVFPALPKPLLTALLVKPLASGACFFQDARGESLSVTWPAIGRLFFSFLHDALRKPAALRRIRASVRRLKRAREKNARLPAASAVENGSPVYLRTDLAFGIRSGGSVGHIAGVLNNLSEFSGPPIFLTTDTIPGVTPAIESHVIVPDNDFADFNEVPSLFFNNKFEASAAELFRGRALSFIYQRYSLNNFSGLKLARRHGLPLVLEFNGSEIWVSREWGTRLAYESLSAEIEDLNLQSADVIVVVSRVLADELKTRGVASDKILVNPNGVDPLRYTPSVDGSEVRTRYGLESKIVVGFIGTFGKWHGAEILAEAAGRLFADTPALKSSLHFFFIGDGVMRARAEEIIRRHGIEAQTTFTGLVPQADGPKFLAACDILVSPHVPNGDGSPFFGSPTKLFEYMAMGRAIVASNLEQIGEVLVHDQTAVLVPPGDPAALAAALRRVAADAPLRARLGAEARHEAVDKYTWKEHTFKIIEKLKRIDAQRQ